MPNSLSPYQQITKVIVAKAGCLSETERKILKDLLDQTKLPFPSYSIIVNYNQTVKQLIKAGKYHWFNGDITSNNFPSIEKGQVEVLIYLINYEQHIKSEDTVKQMGKMNPPLRPATLKELLTLGIAQPDLQRDNDIVALGSHWRYRGDEINVAVPCLRSTMFQRCLNLCSWHGGWGTDWKFAAVRK